MKTVKQLLRQPMKTISGVLIVAFAVAILAICVGQYTATVLTRSNLDDRYNTVALLSDAYFWQQNESGNRVHMSKLPAEIQEWIDNTTQTRPDLVQGNSTTGLVSAYIPELNIDNYSQYENGDRMGDYNIYGDSGTGKTRSIYEKHPATDICRITNYPAKGNVQFDAYKGQPVLVFEEFHSQIPIAAMLNFLDIYPVMLPARYYDRVACYTTVYITSNIPLDQQYPEIQKCKMETWNAFLRRIHTVTEYRKGGFIREVTNENP